MGALFAMQEGYLYEGCDSSQGGSCTHWVHLISVRGLDGCDERAGEFPEMGK